MITYQSLKKRLKFSGTYISNYGTGVLENEIFLLDSRGSKKVYKITFKLKGNEENKIFYIVDDTDVYEAEEFEKLNLSVEEFKNEENTK